MIVDYYEDKRNQMFTIKFKCINCGGLDTVFYPMKLSYYNYKLSENDFTNRKCDKCTELSVDNFMKGLEWI